MRLPTTEFQVDPSINALIERAKAALEPYLELPKPNRVSDQVEAFMEYMEHGKPFDAVEGTSETTGRPTLLITPSASFREQVESFIKAVATP